MPFPQMEDDELNQIIDEVGRGLDSAVAAAQARHLSKADDGKEASPEASASESSPAGDSGGGDSGGPPSDGGESAGGPPGADASASPDASAGGPPAPDASASAGAPPGGDPAAGGEDLETKLQALPDDQLRHLYMSVKQALFARMASADPQASASAPGAPPAAPPAPGSSPSPSPSPAGAPPAPPAASAAPAGAPPAPMEPPPGPPMGKGEMKASPANGGGKTTAVKIGKNQGKTPEGEDLVKSEDSQKIDQLSKQVENLSKALEGTLQFLTQPMRKAVTQISQVQHVAKPGANPEKQAVTNLSKAEITEKLKSLDLRKTTPKDREAVNGFYCGRVGVDKIAHLLG